MTMLSCHARMVMLTLVIALAAIACGPDRVLARDDQATYDDVPYQAEIEEGLGAAVTILIDTSGSMDEPAPGQRRPKYEVAREALEAMLAATDTFVASRPDFPIKIG